MSHTKVYKADVVLKDVKENRISTVKKVDELRQRLEKI